MTNIISCQTSAKDYRNTARPVEFLGWTRHKVQAAACGRCSPADGKNVPGGGADRRAFHPN